MALRNIKSKLLKAWFEMLDGNVPGFNIYRTSVPASEKGNYIVLRIESETGSYNSATNVTIPVIITDIVTKFETVIDDGVANDADDVIAQLLKPGVTASIGLFQQSDMQVVDVKRINQTAIEEDDGHKLIYRLVTRNVHRVRQLGVNDSSQGYGIGTFIVS